MGIPITGITRDQYEAISTEASSQPFPYLSGKWTNHTATVSKIEIQGDNSGSGNDQLVIHLTNSGYSSRIYLNLDPSQVGPGCMDRDRAVQGNLDRLVKAGKALGFMAWKGSTLEVDTKALDKAKGMTVSFGITGAVNMDGTPRMNKKGYQTLNTSLNGLAPELLPVVELPRAPHVTAPANQIPEGYPTSAPDFNF